jgi:hypothetical protein
MSIYQPMTANVLAQHLKGREDLSQLEKFLYRANDFQATLEYIAFKSGVDFLLLYEIDEMKQAFSKSDKYKIDFVNEKFNQKNLVESLIFSKVERAYEITKYAINNENLSSYEILKQLYKDDKIIEVSSIYNSINYDSFIKRTELYVNGDVIEHHSKDGKTYYQPGWNEIQQLLEKKIADLKIEIDQSILDPKIIILDVSDAGLTSSNPMEGKIKELYNLEDFYEAVTAFRETNDIEFVKIADELNSDYGIIKSLFNKNTNGKPIKIVRGTEYEVCDPQFSIHINPAVADINKYLKHYDIEIVTSGAKTFGSAKRKIDQDRFKGNPLLLEDGIRVTYYVNSIQAQERISNVFKNNLNDVQKIPTPKKLKNWNMEYSGYISSKMSAKIGILDEQGMVDGSEGSRASETKIGLALQKEAKPKADRIYQMRRDLYTQDENENPIYKNPNSLTAQEKQRLQSSIEQIMKENQKIIGKYKEHLNFGDFSNISDFFTNTNMLEDLEKKLTKLEQYVMLDPIASINSKEYAEQLNVTTEEQVNEIKAMTMYFLRENNRKLKIMDPNDIRIMNIDDLFFTKQEHTCNEEYQSYKNKLLDIENRFGRNFSAKSVA